MQMHRIFSLAICLSIGSSRLIAQDPGIKAEYFDFTSSLSAIPDFTGRTPHVSRTESLINYSSTGNAWSGLSDNFKDTFAARYTGFIRIDTAGEYTFSLNSDDGSRLYLNDTLLVNNDGLHGMKKVSAKRTLAVGMHALRIEYFENGGGAGLILTYSGPGISEQVVPASVLFLNNPPPLKPGLIAEYFDFTTGLSTIPSFNDRTPNVTRVESQIAYASTSNAWSGLSDNFKDTFAARYTGKIKIDAPGSYTFYTNSDDGSNLYINNALVVDNNGTHSMRERSGIVTLNAGLHDLRVEYFENGGGAGLIVSYQGPGINKVVIPANVLFNGSATPPPNKPPVANAGSNFSVALGTTVTLNGTGSSDPDNGPAPLKYAWTQIGGPAVQLNNASSATPSFTPALVGDYIFSLVVNDGAANSPAATVIVNVFNSEPPTITITSITFKGLVDGTGSAVSSVTADGAAATLTDTGKVNEKNWVSPALGVPAVGASKTYTIIAKDAAGNQATIKPVVTISK